MNIILIYMNKLNGILFTYICDFVKITYNNLEVILNEKRHYTSTNNFNKKYEQENNIMMYIGYMNINNIEELEEIMINNEKKIYLEEIYIELYYNDLINFCKKESLIYKIKMIKYYNLYNKITNDLLKNIYILLINKYYVENTKLNVNKINLLLLNYNIK